MKQTNNAIKFLMAQYRAIFKNAYLKGMASALVLTASLAAAGSVQAAGVNIDETNWETLTGEINVTGNDSATGDNGEYTNIAISGSATNSNTVTINLTGASKAVAATIGDGQSDAITVEGSNTTINLAQSGTNTVSLTVSGAGADSGSIFDVKAINVTKGELKIGDYGTVIADTISLNADEGGTADAKISFTGADATKANSLVGKLISSDANGTLDFTQGFGTLKTYTDENGVAVNITVGATSGATLDLSPADGETLDPNKTTMKLVGGTFELSGSSTAQQGANFTIKYGTLDIGDKVVLTATDQDTGAAQLTLNADAAASDATLRISSEKLTSFLTSDKADGQNADKSGLVNLTKGTIELTDNVDLYNLKV